ncbi:GspE/PulE family protein [Patescibacteria group bacterium]|nr:GspE/PulE family protein [Patescibacteria group bacterium]MDE1946632.1 Flp pilus assembly complex ATPase component TadA [Patescibacteria group bacterium]MDE2010586.1 Flp pilus assembly complex ATPase component TadA [Patescibacteria group bacterium]MDE2233175.1 Flp pilus assembly complex ATPase component TadA [Patescibacteria group bacterium]
MTITFDEDKQKRRLSELHLKEEEDLVQLLSAKYGVEYVNLASTPINADALRLISEASAREAQAAAWSIVDKKVKVAARNPQSEKTRAIIDELKTKGYQPELYISSMHGLEKAWDTYKDLSFAYESRAGSLEISNEEIAAIVEQAKSLPTIVSILENTLAAKKSYRVSRILETIIAGALATDASDIHLEPEESYVRLRYRMDGVLQDVIRFDNDTYGLLLSRIKLLSGMKLNIKKDSQDGRFSIRLPIGDIEVRASVLPGAYNESIVLRLLNPKTINIPLEELGINRKLLDILLDEITRPDGMILTTGPTGSGKTTTLYAFLKKVYDPGVKIITIEDPIEYHLPGIVQTQVNDKGYNFLEGLRAAVRQDPDIIMVGEIRDNETANIALNSALTGHLVFSTLHTNDAAGTFPRLVDLGVNSTIIPSALRVSMAQRLVRRLCDHCKKEKPVEGESKREIDLTIESIEDKSLVPPEHSRMWTAVGCDKCNHTGYKGRIGIYEAILMNEQIERSIQSGASNRDIWLAAKGQGILTMKQDGILKVLAGITSFEELQRVIALED